MFRDKEELYNSFLSPSSEWRGKPFWSWNGELEEEELCRQVEVLKEMGFGGHFMHSRSGLITEYLGEEWFRLINAVADKSEKEGMEAWLYDEDRWPSGSAGGKASKEDEYRMRSLRLTEYVPGKYAPRDGVFAVYIANIREDGIGLDDYVKAGNEDKLQKLLKEKSAEYGDRLRVLTFETVVDSDQSNCNGSGYLNTIDLRSVEHFIDLTHEQYKENCEDRLGTSVKGIFTDEPHRGHGFDDLDEEDGIRTCSAMWTFDIFPEFRKRYGYDAEEMLPELFYKYKGKKLSKIKIDWFDLGCALFNERFAKPINEWCEKNGIEFTGHVLHEDELVNQSVENGSLMRFYENMGVPGVDTLGCENYRYWIVKQLSSAARQTGKNRLLSELYGCTGWDFDFTGHKFMGDWQAFFGINLRCPHLSWYTMEGEAKRDYPASILHQAPWYKDYHDIETYFARFGLLSSGEAICDTLVLNPIESVWGLSHLGWTHWLFSNDEEVNEVERQYEKLFYVLTGSHIDFDYGDEEMMSRIARVGEKDGKTVLTVGKVSYKTVAAGGMLTMRSSTLKLLKEFRDRGGKVVFVGDAPMYLDGEESDEVRAFAAECTEVPFEKEAVAAAVKTEDGPSVLVSEKNCEEVFIRRFRLTDEVYAVSLLNTDRENGFDEAAIITGLPGELSVEEWDLLTGKKYAVPFQKDGNGRLVFRTELSAGDARVFIISRAVSEEDTKAKTARVTSRTELSKTKCAFSLTEDNVCVLDRVVWRADGGEWQEETEVLRADRAVRDHFGIEHRGGEMLQPWYSGLNYNQVLGRIEMKYIFYAEELPEGTLFLAGERPENMNYTINGIPLKANGNFRTDICFKEMPVPENAIVRGRNEVTVSVDFRRNTNFEAIYLYGYFGVKTDGCFPVLTKLPEKIPFMNAAVYGLPFYGADMTYTVPAAAFDGIRERAEKTGERVFLCPEGVKGSLIRYASAHENGKVLFRPYKAEITQAVLAGDDIRITLVGNRRNTYGTLHMLPAEHRGSSPGDYVTSGERWSDPFALPPTGIQKLFVETAE